MGAGSLSLRGVLMAVHPRARSWVGLTWQSWGCPGRATVRAVAAKMATRETHRRPVSDMCSSTIATSLNSAAVT